MTNPHYKPTTLRASLSHVQVCLMLDLFTHLGGVEAGRSYSSCLQQLLVHVLDSQERAGIIKRVSEEEASQRISKVRKELDEDLINLELFNTLENRKLSPETEAKIKKKIEEKLREGDVEINDDILNLFKNSEPPNLDDLEPSEVGELAKSKPNP